ncbi:MAG: thioredoxin family protein, partial [Proteobacteria bacterium]|nr:thioredoxin family protein [Pseudomonadota bacterium]
GHGGRENADVRLGFLASVAGIVTSFMVLAAVLAALKAAGASIGWGIQFQQPVFLAIMVVVVTLFACNLFGLFEITLPSRLNDLMTPGVGSGQGHHHSLGGHFLTGVFATLLATPCSAPFLGTAVGFAFARGTAEIFMVFAALGIGLSLPYLLVAAFPGMATRLPRPGKWMVGMKRFLGVLLAATGLWLVTVIAAETGIDTAAGIAIAALLIGVVLAIRNSEGSRLARHGGKVAALLAAVIVAAPLLAPAGTGDDARALDDSIWQPFDQAEIKRLVANGKTVLVDVTADWCLTCQVNKAAVLNRDPVAAMLESGEVVAMKADWTRPSQEIADYLASFGRYGIPFNAVYGPRAPGGVVLPEILVTGSILAAFEKAAGTTGIAAK